MGYHLKIGKGFSGCEKNRANGFFTTILWKPALVNTAIMSFLLSGFMTIYVTWINLGFVENFISYWLKAWVMAFPAAFIGVFLLAPFVMKLTTKLLGENKK